MRAIASINTDDMALHYFKVLLFLYVVTPQLEALFSRQNQHSSGIPHHIHFDFDDDDSLIVSKHANVKAVRPIISHDKFYPFELSKPLKKPHVNKYLFGKLTLPDSWNFKLTDIEKNLKKEVALEELFRPVPSLSIYENVGFNSLHSPTQIHVDPQFEDIKPVTEHIEDDIKYDFRTKTHSI